MALIPDTSTSDVGTVDIEQSIQPNNTYKMRIEEEKVFGTIEDRLGAVRQAAYKILNTERYKHIIYSWNYGVELADLFGKPIPYCLPEIPRRIREALVQDERINDVTDFDLTYDKKGSVLCKFTIVSIYGDILMQKEVKVGV